MRNLFLTNFPFKILGMVSAIFILLLVLQADPISLIREFSGFTLMGVMGAIFANATGAGGGVIFIPFFNQLGFSPERMVGTSFAIQCCGMTAGALTWWHYVRSECRRQPQLAETKWGAFGNAIAVVTPASITGILMAQYGANIDPALAMLSGNVDLIHIAFGVFSIVLALAIFASIPLLKQTASRTQLRIEDILALIIIAFFGGAITAWLSVGVGELVAVYLILRRFDVTLAIAVAVIITAFTVWFAAYYHVFVIQSVVFQVVLFAGFGAIVGGMLARFIVLALSPQKVKIFFAFWVLVMGLASFI